MVHPHVRGEYLALFRGHTIRCGSSPRAWGIRHRNFWTARTCGFIPTCVGNTFAVASANDCFKVHPHVRGEYGHFRTRSEIRNGSSPRAWGIRHRNFWTARTCGFIPTCVGNTFAVASANDCFKVHPHVRGEYGHFRTRSEIRNGSSPRAWGILHNIRQCFYLSWFIPTCVGNTYCIVYFVFYSVVHPHVRGEYYTTSGLRAFIRGSSPRAWGIPIFVYPYEY